MAANVEQNGGQGAIPWRALGWGAVALALLTPLVAMQFTDEVKWTGSDFAFAGLVLGVVGLGLELAVRMRNNAYTLAVGAALAASLLIVWTTGAVGIIGDEGEIANVLFLGVIGVALLGAVVARFRPGGLVWAMVMAAGAQVSVPLVASLMGTSTPQAVWAPEVLVSTAVLTGLWAAAAWLFHAAARRAGALGA